MIVDHIAFVRPIPILGTHNRQDQFYASEGWVIDVHDYGVTLSKPATQNVPEVPAFCTCGVGYSVPDDGKERQLKSMVAAGIITEADATAMRAGYGSHEEMVKALPDILDSSGGSSDGRAAEAPAGNPAAAGSTPAPSASSRKGRR